MQAVARERAAFCWRAAEHRGPREVRLRQGAPRDGIDEDVVVRFGQRLRTKLRTYKVDDYQVYRMFIT